MKNFTEPSFEKTEFEAVAYLSNGSSDFGGYGGDDDYSYGGGCQKPQPQPDFGGCGNKGPKPNNGHGCW